jgi:hypothetical protein
MSRFIIQREELERALVWLATIELIQNFRE